MQNGQPIFPLISVIKHKKKHIKLDYTSHHCSRVPGNTYLIKNRLWNQKLQHCFIQEIALFPIHILNTLYHITYAFLHTPFACHSNHLAKGYHSANKIWIHFRKSIADLLKISYLQREKTRASRRRSWSQIQDNVPNFHW